MTFKRAQSQKLYSVLYVFFILYYALISANAFTRFSNFNSRMQFYALFTGEDLLKSFCQ